LVGRSPLRYTPAGVAVTEAAFEHRSTVVEADAGRSLAFELDAIAIGGAAHAVGATDLGAEVELTGFLAPRSRRSRKLVLHVVEVRPAGVA
jgi:primosomal replication protein N